MSYLPHGAIDQSMHNRKNDYLYRVSMKSVITNQKGEVLVVKESGRTWWDLPGGGMDHGENIKSAIARELKEEVGLVGNFTHNIIDVEDPVHLNNANVLQVRLIFSVLPEVLPIKPGDEADEIMYIRPEELKDSDNSIERKVYEYATINAKIHGVHLSN